MQHFKSKQKGLSLIELMIALGLGVVIIFGATNSLLTMISSSRVQMTSNDMQQTADRALSYIAYRLRNTLSTSCEQFSRSNENGKLSVSSLSGTVDGVTIKPEQEEKIKKLLFQGIAVNQNKRMIGKKEVVSDELIIINTYGRAFIQNETGLGSATITLQENLLGQNSVVEDNTLYTITNCEYMDIFRGEIENNTITPSKGVKFSENYRALDSSMVSQLEVSEIKIDSDGYLTNKTLFKADDKDAIKLMPDVELMRIFFTVIDENGNTNYVAAKKLKELNDKGEKAKILSAEIFLVIKDGNPSNYTLSNVSSLKIPKTNVKKYDETIKFTDKTMRRLFVRSVAFRNDASL